MDFSLCDEELVAASCQHSDELSVLPKCWEEAFEKLVFLKLPWSSLELVTLISQLLSQFVSNLVS
jgi:hypothetical protein